MKPVLEPESTQREFCKLGAASTISSLSRRTISRAIARGDLPAFRPTGAPRGLLLVRRRDLFRWLEGSPIEATARNGRRAR